MALSPEVQASSIIVAGQWAEKLGTKVTYADLIRQNFDLTYNYLSKKFDSKATKK